MTLYLCAFVLIYNNNFQFKKGEQGSKVKKYANKLEIKKYGNKLDLKNMETS